MKKVLISLLSLLAAFALISCESEVKAPPVMSDYQLVYEGDYVLRNAEDETFSLILVAPDGTRSEITVDIPEESGLQTISLDVPSEDGYGLVSVEVYIVDTVVTAEDDLAEVISQAEAGDCIYVEYVKEGVNLGADTLSLDKEDMTVNFGGNTVTSEVAGNTSLIVLNAENITITNGNFKHAPEGNVIASIIDAKASGFVISDSTFTGNYTKFRNPENGNDNTLRALTAGSGYAATGWTVSNCEFIDVRQPMYVETAGTVENCYVDGTRGWVVCDNADVYFSGNSFGENAEDIAIIENGNNTDDGIYTAVKCQSISQQNNGCRVQQQVKGFRVEEGAFSREIATTEDLNKAIAALETENNVIWNLKNGTYNAQISIPEGKTVRVVGESEDGVVIAGPDDYMTMETIPAVSGESVAYVGIVQAKGASLTLENLTIKGNPEKNSQMASTATVSGIHSYRQGGMMVIDSEISAENVTVADTIYSKDLIGMQNGFGVYIVGEGEGKPAYFNDCSIVNFNKSAMIVRASVSELVFTNGYVCGMGENNVTSQNGIQFSCIATITDSVFEDLSYKANNEWSGGSCAVYNVDAPEGCVVEGNSYQNVDVPRY